MDLKICNFVGSASESYWAPLSGNINHFQPGKIICARIIPHSCTDI